MNFELGEGEDAVTIEVNGEPASICLEYDIKIGVLTVPAALHVRIGHSAVVQELLAATPPNTPFKLRIGERVQFSGWLDGHESSAPNGGTTVGLHGRDHLAPLHDTCITTEASFTEASFVDMVDAAIAASYPNGSAPALIFDAEQNRKAMSGGPATSTRKLKVGEAALRAKLGEQFDTILAANNIFPETPSAPVAQQKTVQAKIGQSWYGGLLKPEFDRAGICLWAASDGESLILSAPNPYQTPIAAFVRRRGQDFNTVNVLDHSYRNVATGRYAGVDVHIRAGGGKGGRGRGVGSFDDEEMKGWGYTRRLTIADSKATSIQQATEFARRKVAEQRRAGWTLTYVVAGHTIEGLAGARVVFAPDTVLLVQDDEIGLSGPYYCESVEFKRGPHTTTTLHLMRPEDVIFGEVK